MKGNGENSFLAMTPDKHGDLFKHIHFMPHVLLMRFDCLCMQSRFWSVGEYLRIGFISTVKEGCVMNGTHKTMQNSRASICLGVQHTNVNSTETKNAIQICTRGS